jgi:hypothetical protein
MNNQVIQLYYHRKGYDIGKDNRFQPEHMKLTRCDDSVHPFTEEMSEMLQTLTHEFLRDFARSISTDELTAEPVLLEYSSRGVREQFVKPATEALIQTMVYPKPGACSRAFSAGKPATLPNQRLSQCSLGTALRCRG